MGAKVPTLGQAWRSKGSAVKAIRQGAGDDQFRDAYERFLTYTAGLRDAREAWYTWLVTDFVAKAGHRDNVNKKTYVSNPTGSTVAIEDLAVEGAKWKLSARLAAFFLQGREAAFVHSVTLGAVEHGIAVYSNEHDGLVTDGPIPEEAIARACATAGLPPDLVAFVEKPFV